MSRILFNRKIANGTLITLALAYLIMLGGGNYEHMTITGLVASAPPKSLYMLQGPYGFSPIKFWVMFRPLTILLFIIAIVSNWHYSPFRRKLLLIAFAMDIAVTAATFLYFAPETGLIAGATYQENVVDQALLHRAQLWKNWNVVRLGGFYLNGVLLLLAVNHHFPLSSRGASAG